MLAAETDEHPVEVPDEVEAPEDDAGDAEALDADDVDADDTTGGTEGATVD